MISSASCTLLPGQREHILKLLRLTSSDHLGERAAAAAKANSYAVSLGGWDAVIPAPAIGSDWEWLMAAEGAWDHLTPWESQFVLSVGRRVRSGATLSEKQSNRLRQIAGEAKLRAAA